MPRDRLMSAPETDTETDATIERMLVGPLPELAVIATVTALVFDSTFGTGLAPPLFGTVLLVTLIAGGPWLSGRLRRARLQAAAELRRDCVHAKQRLDVEREHLAVEHQGPTFLRTWLAKRTRAEAVQLLLERLAPRPAEHVAFAFEATESGESTFLARGISGRSRRSLAANDEWRRELLAHQGHVALATVRSLDVFDRLDVRDRRKIDELLIARTDDGETTVVVPVTAVDRLGDVGEDMLFGLLRGLTRFTSPREDRGERRDLASRPRLELPPIPSDAAIDGILDHLRGQVGVDRVALLPMEGGRIRESAGNTPLGVVRCVHAHLQRIASGSTFETTETFGLEELKALGVTTLVGWVHAIRLRSGDTVLGTLCLAHRTLPAWSPRSSRLSLGCSQWLARLLANGLESEPGSVSESEDETNTPTAELPTAPDAPIPRPNAAPTDDRDDTEGVTSAVEWERHLARTNHEVRTPLVGILGMTRMLAETDLTDEQREYLDLLRTSSEHVLDVVNDALDTSKLSAGKLTLERRPFELASNVTAAVRNFDGKAAERGIGLRLELADGLPQRVVGDSTRLSQVLLNLVGNAVKFTNSGSVTVSVTPIETAADSVRMQFAVTDTGIGIPQDRQADIFEDYEQAEADTTRRFGGTGLGLGLCRDLVELMGGRLELDSTVGEGSTFSFAVEFESAETSPGDVTATPEDAAATASTGDRDLVLVADDDPVNRRVIEHTLRRLGYRAESVPDGRAAIRAVESGRFGLAFVDLTMPGCSGLEVARTLRAAGVETPLVAVTGHGTAGDRSASTAAGFDAHLVKPCPPEALADVLARFFPPTESAADSADESAEDVEPELPILAPDFDDEDLITELVELFLTMVPEQRTRLRDAVRDGNERTYAAAVHTLKGAASALRAERLIACLLKLERRTVAEVNAVEPLLTTLDAEFRTFETFVAARSTHGV